MSMMQTKQKSRQILQKNHTLYRQINDTMATLSQIVGVTLGPSGNPVLIDRVAAPPLVTKDGVTVASFVSFFDSAQHVISEAAKEACTKTNVEAGDGTTTAIVLAAEIVKNGIEYLELNPGVSPQQLTREIDYWADWVVAFIEDRSKHISSDDKKSLYDVAMISSNADHDAAQAVVQAVEYVGDDGTIVTEEGIGRETVVERQNGFPIEKGLSCLGGVHEVWINNPADQECVYDNPLILLFDGDLLSPMDFGKFIQSQVFSALTDQGKPIPPILVIAHKFSPQLVSIVMRNVQMNTSQICLLETPASGHPQSKHALLHDIAAFTGARVFDGLQNNFSTGSLEDLGHVARCRIGRYKSVLFGGNQPDAVLERIEILKGHMKNAESDYDRDLIKGRIANLHGGVATIYVGGDSELEMKEKKHRIEDAINAVRSAIEKGVVTGGGVALLAASALLRKEGGGAASILSRSLSKPFWRILHNAGVGTDQIDSIGNQLVFGVPTPHWWQFGLAKQIKNKSVESIPTVAYDALHHKIVNAKEAGILDPAKVTITSLKNAISIAKMLMTIGGAVVVPRDISEERQAELQAQALAQQMQGA